MYNICQMEKKQTYLSLGNWPQSPSSHHQLQLTPITKRILAQVHLKPQQILPLSFIQFSKMEAKTANCNDFNQSALEFENQRRVKQVSILTSIRNKYILGKDYNSPIKKTSPKPRSLIKSRQSSSNKSHISNTQQFSNLKLAQALSRTKSQSRIQLNSLKTPQTAKLPKKQNSDYFIPFNPHKETSGRPPQKQYMQQQSTKSKGTQPQKSQLTQERHSEYGNFFLNKNTKLRIKKDQSVTRSHHEESKQLCHELITTMERWEELDQEHMREMRKMKDLNQHEKDRLAKMQEIEKAKMRNRIKKIKSRLNSQNTQI